MRDMKIGKLWMRENVQKIFMLYTYIEHISAFLKLKISCNRNTIELNSI